MYDSRCSRDVFALPNAPPDSWSNQCADGQLILTGPQWAQKVLNAFPGFSGTRPKMQVWHGTA